MNFRLIFASTLLVAAGLVHAADPIVIAHRGASGYLPEHTLEAYALAYGMGADFIEQDLVLTKDNRFVALHDIHLEKTTDVEERFPDRKRGDGRWYAADFTLAEIKQLSVHERTGKRFPTGKSRFEVPTMEEAIELIQGLNETTGRNVGIYPELKGPSFHREEGYKMEEQILALLESYGYRGPNARVYVQCFEPESLKIIRNELGSKLPLVQLISGHKAQAELRTEAGLKAVSEYANGIGPSKTIIEENPDYVTWAHNVGLVVHPYTLRTDEKPDKYASAEVEVVQFYKGYGVDGAFTDFPDLARRVVDGLLAGR